MQLFISGIECESNKFFGKFVISFAISNKDVDVSLDFWGNIFIIKKLGNSEVFDEEYMCQGLKRLRPKII